MRGELAGLDPWRADHLKRCIRSASNRHVRDFKQSHAGIQNRLSQTAHVGRWIGPQESRLIEHLISLPALDLYDLQIHIQLQFSTKHRRQFTGRHAMSHRQ